MHYRLNRMGSNANKLHVNLAISDQPKSVDLYCKKAGAEAEIAFEYRDSSLQRYD